MVADLRSRHAKVLPDPRRARPLAQREIEKDTLIIGQPADGAGPGPTFGAGVDRGSVAMTESAPGPTHESSSISAASDKISSARREA